MKINIGTRGSKLALAQANYVLNKIKNIYPNNDYELRIIKTRGDIDLTSPLDSIGSKGIFVNEIEDSLRNNNIQIAVHSMKDMPSQPLDGLCFSKAWKREDPRDALILKDYNSLQELPEGSTIATGSKRRSFQLLSLRPDLKVVNIRGNIDTRLKKLESGLSDEIKIDGIILAAAGLKRLNMENYITEYFDPCDMIPSPAQGTLAIEYASNNSYIQKIVDSLSDEDSEKITFLERGFLKAIGGDCHLPIGAYASKTKDGYDLIALFGNETGSVLAKTKVSGSNANQELINKAVEEINKQLKEHNNE